MMRHLVLAVSLAAAVGCVPTTTTPAPLTINTFTSGADGFDTHSYWIDTGAEVVVFDAQFLPSLAEQLLAEITAATASPVTHVVVTHPNPDKYNGAPIFQDIGAEVIMSDATAAALPGVHAYKEAYFVDSGAFSAGDYPALASADITFTGALTVPLQNGLSLNIAELSSPGVSSTQTIVEVDGAVFVGDLVAGEAHAWLEGGIVDGVATPDLPGWDAALVEMGTIMPVDATVYPGRGRPEPIADAITNQRAYLTAMDLIVADVLSGYADPVAALSDEEDAALIYADITYFGEQAYYDHLHKYLITYGVYGLAWQQALATP